MGNVNITARRFPQQSDYLGKSVRVCFNGELSMVLGGTVVRDDSESPHHTIIRLDDGRHVLGTECWYRLPVEHEEDTRHQVWLEKRTVPDASAGTIRVDLRRLWEELKRVGPRIDPGTFDAMMEDGVTMIIENDIDGLNKMLAKSASDHPPRRG